MLGLRLRLMLTLTAIAIFPLAGVSYVVVRDEVGNVRRDVASERLDAAVAARARLAELLARREVAAIAAASSPRLQAAIRRHETAKLRSFARSRRLLLETGGRRYGTPLAHAATARVQLVSAGHTIGAVVVQAHRARPPLFRNRLAERTGATYRRVETAGALALLSLMLLTFVLARPLLRALRWTEQRAGESRVDALTGIANRRGLEEALDAEIARARRFGHDLAVVLLDLDRFKEINDTHGHDGGDLVLREVGKLLGAAARRQDTVARWGGEEFVVVLPETDLPGARRLAERLRLAIEEQPVGRIRTTASCGVAALLAEDDGASLLAAADEALYRAKATGRNRTETASPRSRPAAA